MSDKSIEGQEEESRGGEDFFADERFDFRSPSPGRDLGKDNVDLERVKKHEQTLRGKNFDSIIDPLLGKTIGNYEVQREIGSGSFGTVYQALDTKLDRKVALKFLRYPLDRQHRELFVREAKVLANLSKHASIVQIYTWGEYQSSYYFALELLESSAEDLIKDNPGTVPVTKALKIVATCASGLQHAHEQGVLHRDIKPANILIDRKTEQAKLCDFGLAKFQSTESSTRASTLAGSTSYMAPEQISGGKISARTDVYSLGVTLYELLSGHLPCEADSRGEVVERIRKGSITPLKKYRPDLPEAILEVVRKSMAYRAKDRFQSADEMRESIEGILRSLDTSGSAQRSPTWVRPRTIRLALRFGMGLAACTAIVLFGGYLLRLSGNDIVAEARELLDDGKYRDSMEAVEKYLALRPDDDFANYLLGYCHFLLGEYETAGDVFRRVDAGGLQAEGLAAVAHALDKEDSRPKLEEALELTPSRYPGLLIASLDVLKGDFKAAINRLEALNSKNYKFMWQRRQHRDLLAQAYYRLKDYRMVNEVYAAFQGIGYGRTPRLSQMYEHMARQQLDEARKARVLEQVKDVAALRESLKSEQRGKVDQWTSRPFRIRISPAQIGRSHWAIELGLTDFLQQLLANELEKNDIVPIEIVDREFLGDLLYEQQLSQLSEDKGLDAVQLGRFLGARLMIQTRFSVMDQEEMAFVEIVDLEDSRRHGLESSVLGRATDPRKWIGELADQTIAKIREKYLIKGKIVAGNDGPKLNVGSNVGIGEGMEFSVLRRPAAEARLGDDIKVIAVEVRETDTKVTLVGITARSLPDEGWYVEEIQPSH